MEKINVIEVKGIRVLTTKQLAEAYGTTRDRIKQNHQANRNRYIEGKHYVTLMGDDLKEFKNKGGNSCLVGRNAKVIYLWTERGCLLHAKSLNTDKAWEVYDYLVDFYFRVKEETPKVQQEKKGHEVVDAPENPKIQKTIREVKSRLAAVDTLADMLSVYRPREEYDNLIRSLDMTGRELWKKTMELSFMEPKMILKE